MTVLMAVVMLAVVALVALAVDVGAIRSDQRALEVAADATATSAAGSIDPTRPTDSSAACRAAWSYLVDNLNRTGAAAPSCATFATTCVATTARSLTSTLGRYTVTFRNPVPNGDPMMSRLPANAAVDGAPCLRFGIELSHPQRKFMHAGPPSTIKVTSVARLSIGYMNGDVVPLLVLAPTACRVVDATGGTTVIVAANGETPGVAVADTDGSACGSGFVLTMSNQSSFKAQGVTGGEAGQILLWALSTAYSPHAYSPGDVASSYSQHGIHPTPNRLIGPVTRRPIDWRYNCKASNLCPLPANAMIDNLRAQLEPVGQPTTYVPTGYTDYSTSYSCNPSSPVIVPVGNWYVDCGSQGMSLANDQDVTFRGGNIVFRNGLTLNGSARLRVNCDVASAATACPTPTSNSVVYVRTGGNLNRASANSSLFLNRTLVYLSNGVTSVSGGGTGTLNWTAPVTSDASGFDDILLWSESTTDHSLNGGGAITLEGTFFTPNARFELTGNSGTIVLNSQFIVDRLRATGSATFRLIPDGTRATKIPARQIAIIR